MNRVLRFILGIFFISISSCSNTSGINYGYLENAKNIFYGNPINVNESYFDEAKYSFIHVTFKKNEAVFVLSNIDKTSNIFTWIGSGMERIKTWNGYVIETQGLEVDFRLDSFNGFSQTLYDYFTELPQHSFSLKAPVLYSAKIDFLKVAKTKKTFKNSFKKRIHGDLYKITKDSKIIGWKSIDHIYFEGNLPVYTEQYLHPYHPDLKIRFFYK